MPVRSKRPEDEQPLFRAVDERRLVGPVARGQEEEASPAGEERAAPQAETAGQAHKGPIARALDSAQENNWVYDSVANTVRENGLADKADEFLARLTGR